MNKAACLRGVVPTEITVRNRQRRVALDLPWLRRLAPIALAECVQLSPGGDGVAPSFEEIAVAIVSDRRMAELHVQFMGIAGPTDVLTFDAGDIAISADTAQVYAAQYGQPVAHEIALYLIHGLLHLQGFDDRDPAARRRMLAVQARVLRACLCGLAAD